MLYSPREHRASPSPGSLPRMALYSYRCPVVACATAFEAQRSMSDDAPTVATPGVSIYRLHRDTAFCPSCGAKAVRDQIPTGVKVGAPPHFQNHIHTTGRPLTKEGHDLVRNRSRWNAH